MFNDDYLGGLQDASQLFDDEADDDPAEAEEAVDFRPRAKIICPDCLGMGSFDDHVCPTCNGTGMVRVYDNDY